MSDDTEIRRTVPIDVSVSGMQEEPTRIDIPLGRLAWMLAGMFVPAGLFGWLELAFPNSGWVAVSAVFYALSVFFSLTMGALAIGDHQLQTGRARHNLGALWIVFVVLIGLPAAAVWARGVAGDPGAVAVGAGYVMAATLMLAIFNREGVSLLLLLVCSLSTAGIASGFKQPLVGAMLGLSTFALGILVSLLRRTLRESPSSR